MLLNIYKKKSQMMSTNEDYFITFYHKKVFSQHMNENQAYNFCDFEIDKENKIVFECECIVIF